MALTRPRGFLRALLPLLLWALLCSRAGVVEAAARAEIVVLDSMSLPGQETFVGAILQRTGLLGVVTPGIQGELLEFFDAEGRQLAALLTDASGYAKIAFRADRTGVFSIQVRLADNPRVHAEPASGRLFVREKGRPLFFTTVEGAIRKEGGPRGPFAVRLKTEAAPLPGARETLTRAAACSTPVYLTATPKNRLNEVRRWLSDHSFPEAPVLLLRSNPDPKQPDAIALDTELFTSLRNERAAAMVLVTANPGLAARASKEEVDVYLLGGKGASGSPGKEPESTQRIRRPAGWEEIPTPCDGP